MDPTTIRDMNFDELRGKLEGWRERVWTALHKYGPCTTHELAGASGLSLLTIRPRVTELVQLGFAECTGTTGKEGTYKAVSIPDALDNFNAARAARTTCQLQLGL